MKVCLLRVGIDTGCGGILGPVFADGSFEFVPIPERRGAPAPTYAPLVGRRGVTLDSYFPPGRQGRMAATPVHPDPEFETFTYGDISRLKRSLRNLEGGDLLAFYAGLSPQNYPGKPALYLIGYFEVQEAGSARCLELAVVERLFAANAHLRYRDLARETDQGLVLVKGGPGSRLLERAVPISTDGLARGSRRVHVLSPPAQAHLGRFTELNAIERCVPRWVQPEFAERAAEWIRSLP